jgi:hypothetical protein
MNDEQKIDEVLERVEWPAGRRAQDPPRPMIYAAPIVASFSMAGSVARRLRPIYLPS